MVILEPKQDLSARDQGLGAGSDAYLKALHSLCGLSCLNYMQNGLAGRVDFKYHPTRPHYSKLLF